MLIKRLSVGLLVLLLTPVLTAVAMDVHTDYDRSADFRKFKTFGWISAPSVEDPLMRQRVQDAVTRKLQEKGLILVANPDDADLGIQANSTQEQMYTFQSFYDAYPGWGWGGWGSSTAWVDTYTVGTLVVDLFDMDSKRAVWRGTATSTVSHKPEKNAKKILKATTEMFEDYPPRRES